MSTKAQYERAKNNFDRKEKNAEREQVKTLISMLPKVKILSQKEEYLAGLDSQERKRVLLREYFSKLNRSTNKRPIITQNTRLDWLVCQKPFPQLFHYRAGDEILFEDCLAVRFTRFHSAYKLYIHLLKNEVKQAITNKTAGYYKDPRNRG